MSILSQFLSAGGAKLIPQPEILLSDLLSESDKIGNFSRKPIALLINYDPVNMSPIFWKWYIENNKIKEGLSLLSEITIFAPKLQQPNDDENKTISQIVELCKTNISVDLPFSTIESSLLTIRWLVRLRIFIPSDVFPRYQHNALNALAVECWAEYSYYGDLTKLPEFPQTTDTTIQRGYLQIVTGSVSNPNFSFEVLKIPHWVWHACLREFGYENSIQPQSLLSLSLVELDCCIEIAHVLPSFMFIHAMRVRSRNSDINIRLIKLVAQTPSSVLTTHIDDFEDFVDNILEYHPLAYELAASFRENIVSLREHMPRLINHISMGLDYFDEDNMSGRLLLLNSLFVFTPDLVPFIDIFDAIREALSLIPLSLSLCKVLFDFFGAIARFVEDDKQNELALIAIAALSAMFSSPRPSCIAGNQIAEKVYDNAKTFYSFVSSDIIVDPNYTIQDSFVLASPALIILKQINVPVSLVKYVLRMLPPLLDVCPVEATVVATSLFENHVSDYTQEYVQFNYALKNIVQHDSSTAFVMVVSYYQMKAAQYFPLDLDQFLHATIFTLPDDVSMTRLNIQLDPGLAPMLVTKPEQLSLLLENWAPPTSDVFLAVVAKEIKEKVLSWRDEKCMRSFLRVFGYHEPVSRSTVTWLSREFITQDDKVSQLEIEECSDEDLLMEFSRAYALPVPHDPSSLPLAIAQMYGKSKKCFNFLKRYLTPIASELARNSPNAFWLMRLLGFLNIRYKFPPAVNNEYCRALGVRTKRIPAPDPSQAGDGFFAVETLSSYGNNDDENRMKLLSRLKSPYLSLKFAGSNVTQNYLKALSGGKMSSTSRSFFIRLASFAEIRSQPTMFAKNESAACELLKKSDLRDPVTFREIFLLIVTLVTQSSSILDSSHICDAFLSVLPKQVTDVQLYEALPILTGITRIAGEQSKGRQSLVEALSSPEFDDVNYADFQTVRSNLAAC